MTTHEPAPSSDRMLHLKVEEKIGHIALDINEENTLNGAVINEIIRRHEEFDNRKDVNVIFLSSQRDKYFCNGLDPNALRDEGSDVCFGAIVHMVPKLYSLRKPMVACINGYALAGGAVLGILADYRFADHTFKCAFSEILLNLTMPRILIDIIRNTVGPFHAKHLCQTGKIVKAEEALSMGLVDNLFEPDELYKKSFNFAKKIARFSPSALAYMKKSLRAPVMDSFNNTDIAQEKEVLQKCLVDPSVGKAFEKLLKQSKERKKIT